jgi:hypothetical protein
VGSGSGQFRKIAVLESTATFLQLPVHAHRRVLIVCAAPGPATKVAPGCWVAPPARPARSTPTPRQTLTDQVVGPQAGLRCRHPKARFQLAPLCRRTPTRTPPPTGRRGPGDATIGWEGAKSAGSA